MFVICILTRTKAFGKKKNENLFAFAGLYVLSAGLTRIFAAGFCFFL